MKKEILVETIPCEFENAESECFDISILSFNKKLFYFKRIFEDHLKLEKNASILRLHRFDFQTERESPVRGVDDLDQLEQDSNVHYKFSKDETEGDFYHT